MALSSTRTLSTLLTTVLLLLISTTNAQQRRPLAKRCDNGAGNYTTNSTFSSNLNSLLENLTSNDSSAGGFSDGYLGSIPDRVYGLVLCRGDIDSSRCRACLSTGAQDLVEHCPIAKAATIWYNYCLLRYSNQRFASDTNTSFRLSIWKANNVTSAFDGFDQVVATLMGRLRTYAAYNTSSPPPRLFATGETMAYPTIYGLVQCTRDLSSDDCNRCLKGLISHLPSRCSQRVGCRILAASCNIRYEVNRFYNTTSRLFLPDSATLLPSASPPPMPSASTPPITPTPTTNSTNAGKEKRKTATPTILAIVVPMGVVSVLLLVYCTCYLRRKAALKSYRRPKKQEIMTTESLLVSLQTIRIGTDNFSESNKLGQGGFGVVYKGKLADGQEIAVKRLSTCSMQGVKELKNEVMLLAKLQHRNLVRLLGVCLEEEEKLLIYEYVENKSLDTILFDHTRKEQLHWEKRYKIIYGIARAMLYLHEESQVKIIHRDLKASNVLLGSNMNPKISDFGLARLFSGDQTQASTTRVAGTFGYMPPEYVMRGQFSNKSDIFSFGVLVLEIVTGRKNSDFFNSENSFGLLSYVWEHWSNGTLSDIVDASFGGNYPRVEALRCIQIGLLCVQEVPSARPTMSSVVLMLNSNSTSIQVPSRPAYVIGYTIKEPSDQSKRFCTVDGINRSNTKSVLHTPNELSITELDPR